MVPLRFVPDHLADEIPNVVVDGSANGSTRLVLSHWPGSPTPTEVLDDLSAQIAFRALDHPQWFDGIDAVTNNHFDQDGLCSAFTLIDPSAALARRDAVVDVARAGDFGTFESRDAVRAAFVIAAFDDPALSPLGPKLFDLPYPERCGQLYEAVLPQLTEILDHPDRYRPLWQREDGHLTESLEAIERGIVTIDERPDIDLATFVVPEDWAAQVTHRFTQTRHDALHPMAVNQSTGCLRTLVVQGQHFRLECRYETWVMFTSHTVQPRPDLRDLAGILDGIEPAGVTWTATAPGSLTPTLAPTGGHSDIDRSTVEHTIRTFLATAPPAWDPFARQ